MLFSFFDRQARWRKVERIEEVEPAARSAVMVEDPKRHLKGDRVFVADLSKKQGDGSYRSWIETRSKWLERATPKTSKLRAPLLHPPPRAEKKKPRSKARKRKSRKRRRRKHTKNKGKIARSSPDSGIQPKKKRKVILFGTAWCSSCRLARAYFKSRGIAFSDLDVEKDQRAARQFITIQRTYGLRPGVVPMIIINGRIFQGFSRLQIETALKAK